MSLRTCPKCNRPVLTYGRYLTEALYMRDHRCPFCSSALGLKHRSLQLIISLAGPLLIMAFSFGRHQGPGREIPFGLGIAAIVAFFLILKAVMYYFDDWKVRDVSAK